MATNHSGGNIQPGLDLEEHVGELNAKRVSLISAATIYAVVNTGAAGTQNSMATLNSGPNQIGSVTVSNAVTLDRQPILGAGDTNALFVSTASGSAINVRVLSGSGVDWNFEAGGIPDVYTVGSGGVKLQQEGSPFALKTSNYGNVTTYSSQYSFYQQSSLVSGYSYYGFALPGSNPTTSNFKIQRETLNSGEVLFGGGAATFAHRWSAASLASLTYL
jgi:hypothetical protein